MNPFFKFYRSTDEIFLYVWNEYGAGKINGVPDQQGWHNNSYPTIETIKFWEHLYQAPGNLGIFAAHSPLVEFYMFVYYPLVNNPARSIKTFHGKDAVDHTLYHADRLGITLVLTPPQ